MSPAVVALLVAGMASVGGVLAAAVNSRSSTKTTVQSAVTKTLEQVWEQRLQFRDEQIAELRADLSEATAQIARLTSEVARLSALVVELGGAPHDK